MQKSARDDPRIKVRYLMEIDIPNNLGVRPSITMIFSLECI